MSKVTIPPELEKVTVALDNRSYPVFVGAGLLDRAGELVAPYLSRARVIVVTDKHVARLHLGTLAGGLERAGVAHDEIVLPPGEETKDFAHLAGLVEALLARGVERRDLVIAFGGGVVGDLTGFAAAILRRGVPFAQMPTTLLAQVDSAVGGKTAINTAQGKNLAGAFHQPRIVLADIALLETLEPREFRAGYAETVKYGLIDDPALFAWLEDHGREILRGDLGLRKAAVAAAVRAKARIVAADERESGERALLNLGHTFGHALEAATGYSDRLLHGEGVAIGLCLAFRLSARLGLAPETDAATVERHLARAGLPTRIADIPGPALSRRQILEPMAQDKKAQDGRATFVLVHGIGRAFLTQDVPEAAVSALIEEELEAQRA